MQDGIDDLNLGKINEIVDQMIQRNEIPPILMVMVPPLDRNKEYWANADFARAFATELVPAIDAKYRTKPDAGSRRCSAHRWRTGIDFSDREYPQVYSNSAGQSSAVFADNDLEKLITRRNQMCGSTSTWGRRVKCSQHDLLAGKRRLRDPWNRAATRWKIARGTKPIVGKLAGRIPEALRISGHCRGKGIAIGSGWRRGRGSVRVASESRCLMAAARSMRAGEQLLITPSPREKDRREEFRPRKTPFPLTSRATWRLPW